MKFYLKVITPLFVFAFVYSFFGICFGPRGFFARRQLKQQREVLLQHVRFLSDIGEDLNIRIVRGVLRAARRRYTGVTEVQACFQSHQ